MLRPATPLSVLLFVALVLLLLSVISVPIVKGVKLATYQGVDFGVFGYCKDSKCSKVMLGYSTDNLFKQGDGDFSLPSSARHSLSAILIVHPIAALLTLILLILSLSAHLHSPSHSPRYLLILLILTIPTLLLALLAFLVDLLLFVPHVQWGGWIVLAATIIIAASGIITCAMRRTLVGRKARQRRIAQNPEMNGENFRKRLDQEPTAPTFGQPTAPMVNGTPGADKLPEFTTLTSDVSPQSDGINNDERTLLSSRNPPNPNSAISLTQEESLNRYESPQRMGSGPRLGRGRGYGGPVDEFGNPLPQGLRRDPSDPRLHQQYSNGSLGSSNSVGLPPFPGRGRGHGPSGRVYGRGGPPPPGGFRGPTPPGMNGGGRGMGMGPTGAGSGMMMGGLGRGGQRGPPPGYNNWPAGRGDPYNGEPSTGPGYGRRGSPGVPSAPGYRGPTLGLPSGPGSYDAYSGPISPEDRSLPPPMLPTPVGYIGRMDAQGGFSQWRENDGDVRGMVDLQQGRVSPRRPSGMSSDESVYSQPEYVPARSNWAAGRREGTPPVPPIDAANYTNSPVELPAAFSNDIPTRGPRPGYYEDVDPRFADKNTTPPIEIPASLIPGYSGNLQLPNSNPQPSQPRSSNTDGSRSTTVGATSNFTPVPQRPENQNLKPISPVGGQSIALRRPTPQQQDIMDGGPDSQISAGKGVGRGIGPPGQAPGTGDEGRYPGPGAV
ncbi:MAG: regulator of ime2 [Geoglossum simile]|nr:MAG: regulator of ime2 [Geoglossum simile]